MSNFFPQGYLNTFNVPQVSASYVGFNPVRDSKENLFASNLMPLPPKFAFQERSSRLNWRMIMNTDLDKVQKEIDLKQLETLLTNITFSYLDRDDLERLGDQHFIKLFRLSQYSIEYLLYTQNYLESLVKELDSQYRTCYEKTQKTEEMIKKYQQELKMIRKEIKLKQKTLSTYEYLMKLPVEQEQEVIKCKHCPKFFLSKQYLQKHYQKNHPEIDFYREFQNENLGDKTINERQTQPTQIIQQTINQDELFDKIKSELFVSLSQNFQKIEGELKQVKEKQNMKHIQDLLQNYEQKNEEEKRRIQESLQKPAKMLEELKSNWSELFQQQTTNMKDMIQNSVNEALQKRKDDREKRKQQQHNKSGEISSDGLKDSRIKMYEQRFNEFDEKFKENEKIKEQLEKKLKDYERVLQEKATQEQELLKKLKEEELKRKEEEKLRSQREKELEEEMKKKYEEDQLKIKQQEQKIREEHERKLKEEQEKIKQSEEQKRNQLLKEQEQEKLMLLKKQQELEQRQKELELQAKQRELEEQEKLKRAQQVASLFSKPNDQQESEEQKKKEELKDGFEEEEEIVIEEEEEEEKDSDIEPPPKQQDNKINQAKLKKQEKFKKILENDGNKYEGETAIVKSLFSHSQEEIKESQDELLIKNISLQEQILQQEFKQQKIQPSAEIQSTLSSQRKEDLRHVNDMIRGIQRKDVQKVNNSLQKRLSDEEYAKYNGILENLIRKTFK